MNLFNDILTTPSTGVVCEFSLTESAFSNWCELVSGSMYEKVLVLDVCYYCLTYVF